MISMAVEAIIFNMFTSKEIKWKKYIIIGIVGILAFNILGNFRSGSETMNEIFST